MLGLPSSFLCVQISHLLHVLTHDLEEDDFMLSSKGSLQPVMLIRSPSWLKNCHVTQFWPIRCKVKSAGGVMEEVSLFLEKRPGKRWSLFSLQISSQLKDSGMGIAIFLPGWRWNQFIKECRAISITERGRAGTPTPQHPPLGGHLTAHPLVTWDHKHPYCLSSFELEFSVTCNWKLSCFLLCREFGKYKSMR